MHAAAARAEATLRVRVLQGGMPGVDLAVAPIDDSTKLALQAGIALLGVVGVGLGARTAACQCFNKDNALVGCVPCPCAEEHAQWTGVMLRAQSGEHRKLAACLSG
jgi:hypothetical protein